MQCNIKQSCMHWMQLDAVRKRMADISQYLIIYWLKGHFNSFLHVIMYPLPLSKKCGSITWLPKLPSQTFSVHFWFLKTKSEDFVCDYMLFVTMPKHLSFINILFKKNTIYSFNKIQGVPFNFFQQTCIWRYFIAI